METPKWKPTEEEREVMEAVWMQVKSACEKLKEETNAQDEHIRKMLQELADFVQFNIYQSRVDSINKKGLALSQPFVGQLIRNTSN